jgi:hypothetical protein
MLSGGFESFDVYLYSSFSEKNASNLNEQELDLENYKKMNLYMIKKLTKKIALGFQE